MEALHEGNNRISGGDSHANHTIWKYKSKHDALTSASHKRRSSCCSVTQSNFKHLRLIPGNYKGLTVTMAGILTGVTGAGAASPRV